MSIGGNITAVIQQKSENDKNTIGERVHKWTDIASLDGFLDLSNGDSGYTNYSAKIEESTHVFMCDYQELTITSENTRMLIKGRIYTILLIDNPMEMDEHLEIYLKYVGVG